MAIAARQPQGVIHHSDHGSQYTALKTGARCAAAGIVMSMGSVGDCYDNAMAETFFASLECELIDRTTLRTPVEARAAVPDRFSVAEYLCRLSTSSTLRCSRWLLEAPFPGCPRKRGHSKAGSGSISYKVELRSAG